MVDSDCHMLGFGHWLPQSAPIRLSSQSISALDRSSVLPYVLSTLSSRNALSGFPYYNMACLFEIPTIKKNAGQVNQ